MFLVYFELIEIYEPLYINLRVKKGSSSNLWSDKGPLKSIDKEIPSSSSENRQSNNYCKSSYCSHAVHSCNNMRMDTDLYIKPRKLAFYQESYHRSQFRLWGWNMVRQRRFQWLSKQRVWSKLDQYLIFGIEHLLHLLLFHYNNYDCSRIWWY